MVFSAISSVSSFDADDSVGARQGKKNCDITMQSDLEWKWSGKIVQQNWFIQTKMELSSTMQSALILWDLSIQGGRGVLAVKVFTPSSIMWRVRHLVWQWVVIILLADQHQK